MLIESIVDFAEILSAGFLGWIAISVVQLKIYQGKTSIRLANLENSVKQIEEKMS